MDINAIALSALSTPTRPDRLSPVCAAKRVSAVPSPIRWITARIVTGKERASIVQQLDLWSVEPEPEPDLVPVCSKSLAQIEWQRARADFYLRLMGRFLKGSKCPQPVRRHEIERIHQMRQSAIAVIHELGGHY
jgi:hypothetical protein